MKKLTKKVEKELGQYCQSVAKRIACSMNFKMFNFDEDDVQDATIYLWEQLKNNHDVDDIEDPITFLEEMLKTFYINLYKEKQARDMWE